MNSIHIDRTSKRMDKHMYLRIKFAIFFYQMKQKNTDHYYLYSYRTVEPFMIMLWIENYQKSINVLKACNKWGTQWSKVEMNYNWHPNERFGAGMSKLRKLNIIWISSIRINSKFKDPISRFFERMFVSHKVAQGAVLPYEWILSWCDCSK